MHMPVSDPTRTQSCHSVPVVGRTLADVTTTRATMTIHTDALAMLNAQAESENVPTQTILRRAIYLHLQSLGWDVSALDADLRGRFGDGRRYKPRGRKAAS